MHWIDWTILAVPMVLVAYITWRTQRYVKSVADFLTAGRVAGRYVVAVAGGEAAMGLISIVALFQVYYLSGFAIGYWQHLIVPVTMLISLTGFAIYRYRETRSMTLAQFFELRYGKSFRIYAGILMATSGIINYGIFPAVGARFIIYFLDLPMRVDILGFGVPTLAIVMGLFLTLACVILLLGGHLTGMVTDCVQGILSYPMWTVVCVSLLIAFGWGQMSDAMLDRPPGESMLNPFDTGKLKDFNPFYIVVGMVGHVYNVLSWQGAQAYYAAALTPHEQKMGRILGTWRGGFVLLVQILVAIAAFTYMHHAAYQTQAQQTANRLDRMVIADLDAYAQQRAVRFDTELLDQARRAGVAKYPMKEGTRHNFAPDPEAAAALTSSQREVIQTFEATRKQMILAVTMVDILPVGVTGAFLAAMIFLMISTDTTYMHSWGSILIQDVLLPWRKTPFTPRAQMWLLRGAIISVAIFGFCFSLLFAQTTYIMFFFQLTGAIWLGGAGAVILGGLYWNRGTNIAAWVTLIIGSSIAVGAFFAEKNWVGTIYPFLHEGYPGVLNALATFCDTVTRWSFIDTLNWQVVQWEVGPNKMPINGIELSFINMMLCCFLYVVISLLTCREPFNMDRMLHRGKYRKEAERAGLPPIEKPRLTKAYIVGRLIGIDSQFTTGDKILSWSVFAWSMLFNFVFYIGALVWHLIDPWPESWWAGFMRVQIIILLIYGAITTVWFLIGGTWDLNRMFKRLATMERNFADDGRVIGHVNAEDLAVVRDADLMEQVAPLADTNAEPKPDADPTRSRS